MKFYLRSDGTPFESLDGSLAGDEWKEYARDSDHVWYVGGSNANDQINVDFVTEPGLLTDHHLITRLTENNGNFSFSAQVKLDFSATDGQGDAVWNVQDLRFKLDQLLSLSDADERGEALNDIAESAVAVTQSELIATLLPPEGDFLVILIDALDGNDQITVGPTVQKTVWVDAGAGDDRVEIRSGNAILVDRAESSTGTSNLASRNDIPAQAFTLLSPNTDDADSTFDGKTLDDGLVTFTGLSIDSPTDTDWYVVTLAGVPAPTSKIELASVSPIDELLIEVFDQADVDPQTGNLIGSATPLLVSTSTGDRSSISDLSSLATNTAYIVKISSPNIVPTVYDLQFNLTGVDIGTLDKPLEINMSLREDTERRDVILGGTGDDILRGGAGEDWIFGNEGNDVITGGDDRNASDLLFGGPGNDTFQIIPDELPLLGSQPDTNFNPATETFIPTYSEQLIGGDGTDRVLFLGGDLDRRGFDVPDFASMRYNTGLHRYEFTSLIWDIGTQQFATDFIDLDGNGTQDSGESTIYKQEYFFFQTRDVEQVQFALGDGDDVLHLDPEFQFLPIDISDPENHSLDAAVTNPGLFEEWGMDRGDFEQGAFESIIIDGGEGNDHIFGTPTSDLINGGPGDDYIVGGLGNDEIHAEGGDDQIFGNAPDAADEAFPKNPVTSAGSDKFESEAYVFDLARPYIVEQFPNTTGLSNTGGFISPLNSVGDFNDDGFDDFIASTATESYVFFGPIGLTDFEPAKNYANIVIDHAVLGRPASSFGDLDGDGVSDLVFLTEDQGDGLLTIISGGAVASAINTVTNWPRDWNASFVQNVLIESGNHTNVRRIRIDDLTPEMINVATVNVLNADGDAIDDLLIMGDTRLGPLETTASTFTAGYVFSGQTVGAFSATADKPELTQADRTTRIRATDNISALSTTLPGDVNGDGIDEILFGNTGLTTTVHGVLPAVVMASSTPQAFNDHPSQLTISVNNRHALLEVEPNKGDPSTAEFYAGLVNAELQQSNVSGLVTVSAVDGKLQFQTVQGGSDTTLSVHETTPPGSAAANPLGFESATQLHDLSKSVNATISSGAPDVYSSVLTVTNINKPIVDLNVRMTINHTYTADLDVSLVHPDGTRIVLFQDVGGSGDNFTTTELDDEASTPIGSGTAPFTGSFVPAEPLSVFDGKLIDGKWTLEVVDDAHADGGLFVEWRLLITTPDTTTETGSQFSVAAPSNGTPFANAPNLNHNSLITISGTNDADSKGASIGDVNQDGFDDVAIFDGNSTEFYFGASNLGSVFNAPHATISGPVTSVTGSDLDGNGNSDVIIADANQIHLFDRLSTESPGTNLTLANATDAVAFDGLLPSTSDGHISFDGSGFDAAFPPNALLNGLNEITATFWIRTDKAGNQGVFSVANGSSHNAFTAVLRDKGQFRVHSGVSGHINNQVNWYIDSIADNEFHHVAIIRDPANNSAELFIDGASQGVQVFDSAFGSLTVGGSGAGSDDFVIGRQDDLEPLQAFVGDLDDVAFWSRKLTPQEIITVSQQGPGSVSTGLRGWYAFDERDGNVLVDETGTYNGTLDTGSATPTITVSETRSLSHTAGIDLDQDGVGDLVVSTNPQTDSVADNTGNLHVTYGSRNYGIDGQLELTSLPDEFEVLENFNVSGSGSFVVNRGEGRFVFNDGGDAFQLNQEERWFQFTTIGDGRPRNAIHLEGAVVADLVDEFGGVLESSQKVIDLRKTVAGVYYLRVRADETLSVDDTPTLDYDAGNTGNSINTWLGGVAGFDATVTGATIDSNVSSNRGVTQAYVFDGTGGATLPSLETLSGDPTDDSVAVEVWFRPSDLTGNEVLFESGGEHNGLSLNIEAAPGGYRVLLAVQSIIPTTFGAQIRSQLITSNDEFVQAIAVWDKSAEQLQLYVDGVVTGAPLDINPLADWSGTNATGIAQINGAHGAVPSGFSAFTGEIASVRLYESANIVAPSFTINMDAPIRGQQQIIETDGTPDRDLIHGGEGDDQIFGNHDLDRIYGDGGNDIIVGEEVELHDITSGETITSPVTSQLVSQTTPPPLDPVVITQSQPMTLFFEDFEDGDFAGQDNVVTGRYIRVKNGTADRTLHISEIEVFGPGVTASSTLDSNNDLAHASHGASFESFVGTVTDSHTGNHANLVNGVLDTSGNTPSIDGVGAEFVIDLGYTREIGAVRVWQRADGCCQDRLSDFTVSVLGGTTTPSSGVVTEQSYPGQVPTNSFATFEFGMVDTLGINEPSGTRSLRFNGYPNGGDQVESDVFDLSDYDYATLSYRYQRTGGGEGPESADDLILEYRNVSGADWMEAERQLGSGSNMTTFAKSAFSVPAIALTEHFQFRFRNVGTTSTNTVFDDWFVDDVRLTASADAMSAALANALSVPTTARETGVVIQQDITASDLFQLTDLDASDYDNIRDLSQLRNTPNLRSLNLAGNPITDDQLSFIAELKDLRSLDLQGTNINPHSAANQAIFDSLPKLTTLYLPVEGLAADTNLIADEGDTIDVTRTRTSIDFNGSTTTLTSASTIEGLPIGNEAYTISAWIKPDVVSGTKDIIGWGNYGVVGQFTGLAIVNGGLNNFWWNDDLSVSEVTLLNSHGIDLDDGDWHHVVATYDGSERALHVDGVEVARAAASGRNVPSANQFSIGGSATGTSRNFDGGMSEVGIWNRALSSAEVSNNFNASLQYVTDGQVAFWEMNEGTGTAIESLGDNAQTIPLANASFEDAPTIRTSNPNYSTIPGWPDPGAGGVGISSRATGNIT